MTTRIAALPHWDMSVFFPGLDSAEYKAAFAAIIAGIDQLTALVEEYGIGAQQPGELDDRTVRGFDAAVVLLNSVLQQGRTVGAYISGFVSTDSRDTLAQARMSELQQQMVRLAKLSTRFTAWIGALDVDGLIGRSQAAAEHEYVLRKARTQAEHLMSPGEEDLAVELGLVAGSAWSKMYGNLTSQISVTVAQDGAAQQLPISAVRNMAYDEDRESRRRGYEAELKAWQRAGVPIAAALNGVKGETNILARRRGWETPLDIALFNNNIDRETLAAMQDACRASFPDFRRYMQAKARLLGVPVLAWYDLFAPVGSGNRVWEYDDAADFIVRQFGTFSPRMSDFAARAFRESWIDAEPRAGKRDGAFCMAVRGDESRILANFKPAFPGLSTLAHELGHGYHNINLAERTQLQRGTPMTLAETASIFCETIIRHAGLAQADAEEQLSILEASLQGSTQVVVDIFSRFLFEQSVFERREARELSIDEFNNLMLDAQRETYGDGLDGNLLHPYMWAAKSHYYGSSYYNFPYTFGMLFGLGLYARYQHEPEEFRRGYDDLLSSTGLAGAAELAQRFGIDIRTPAFWHASLDIVRQDIDRFEQLVAERPQG